jgi:hypothetical protein
LWQTNISPYISFLQDRQTSPPRDRQTSPPIYFSFVTDKHLPYISFLWDRQTSPLYIFPLGQTNISPIYLSFVTDKHLPYIFFLWDRPTFPLYIFPLGQTNLAPYISILCDRQTRYIGGDVCLSQRKNI